MLNIIFLVSLLITQDLFAQSPSTATKVDPNSEDFKKAAALFARDISPSVTTLERDIKVFHYFNCYYKKKFSDPKTRDQVAYDDITYQAKTYWNTLTYSGVVGNGFYAARDPLYSNRYGNCLYDVDIKAGTKVLSIINSWSLQKDTLAALDKIGCKSKNGKETIQENINTAITNSYSRAIQNGTAYGDMITADNGVCGDIYKTAVRALGVSLISYNYGDYFIPGCPSMKATFVLVDENLIKPSNISILAEGATPITSSEKEDYEMIKLLYSEYNNNYNKGIYKNAGDIYSTRIIPDSEILSTLSEEQQKKLMDWKKKNIYGCANVKNENTEYKSLQISSEEAVTKINQELTEFKTFFSNGLVACHSSDSILVTAADIIDTNSQLVSDVKNEISKICNYEKNCWLNTISYPAPNSKLVVHWNCVNASSINSKFSEFTKTTIYLSCP